MIINSMSRKTPSFHQLIDYMGYLDKDSAVFGISYNLSADRDDTQAIINEFEENHAYLPKRKNGNALYHEIIALPPDSKMPRRQQIEALRDLAYEYLKHRAEYQLAYGVIHTDTPHLHMHLVISSNELMSKKRQWLYKKDFADILERLEEYKLERYQQLGTERYHDRNRQRQKQHERKQSNRERAITERHHKPSHKAELTRQLKQLLEQSKTHEQLSQSLSAINMKLYTRGKSAGIETDGGKRYRFSTLGLSQHYTDAMTRYDLYASRLAGLSRRFDERERDNDLEWELER